MYLIQPLIWARLLWRSIRISNYRVHWLERYGYYFFSKNIKPGGIVLHAVSLGEILSAKPLIYALQKYYPNIIITLTSMTSSGLELANRIKSKNNNNNNNTIQCLYLPYDCPGSMRRFVNKIKPKLVIVIETELWPNLIYTLHQRNIPFVIANARLSWNSFIKYKKLSQFFSLIMKRITFVAAQHTEDASRFFKLGLKQNQLYITGNLKFDILITPDLIKKTLLLKNTWIKKRLTWIAGSTHKGEEILLLEVHKKLLTLFPDLLMILAPRHPERFDEVINITKRITCSYVTKSSKIIPQQNTQIIINDTIGDLISLYSISDIAFIGGSLVKHIGGHNPLEAAVYSIPIITGPYIFNFKDICAKLYESNGLISITDSKSLISVLSMLLTHKNRRIYYGNCAYKVFKSNQGSLQKLLKILQNYLPN